MFAHLALYVFGVLQSGTLKYCRGWLLQGFDGTLPPARDISSGSEDQRVIGKMAAAFLYVKLRAKPHSRIPSAICNY